MKKTLFLMILCVMTTISTCFAVDTNHVIGANILSIHDEENAQAHAIMIPSDFPYYITSSINSSNGICIARW